MIRTECLVWGTVNAKMGEEEKASQGTWRVVGTWGDSGG